MSRNPVTFEHLSFKVDELKTVLQLRGLPSISVKDQTVNSLGFVGHGSFCHKSQLRRHSVKSATGDANRVSVALCSNKIDLWTRNLNFT